MTSLNLGLSTEDELESGVDRVAREIAHQIAVPADCASYVVVKLSINAQIEGFSSS